MTRLQCTCCNNELLTEEERYAGKCDDCTEQNVQWDDAWEDIGHTPKPSRSDDKD